MPTDELYVIKRNNQKEPISFDKVLRRLRNLTTQLSIDGAVVAQKVCSQIFPGVTTKQLDELAAQICTSMSTMNPDYGRLASRIIISNHHKNTNASYLEVCAALHAQSLISDKLYATVRTHLAQIEAAIDYERDYRFGFFGFKTLEKSYLLKTDTVVERPQQMYMRVALGLYGEERDLSRALACYDELSQHQYIHATPTLFNAGTPKNQLASCFLLSMKDDSIQGIFDTLKDCAMISKFSGGIGLHIHNIRASGAAIHGTNGSSSGIVPMLRVFNDTARYVDQGGGKRNGSFAIYLEPWHSDIFDFLQLRRNHGDEQSRARDLFYALWVPDLFMRRVQTQGVWSLMTPDECPGLSDCWGKEFETLYEKYESQGKFSSQVPAQTLWLQILNSQIETGTPYLLYKDQCNRKSNQQNLGTIKSSNLCTEIIEYSDAQETAVCNLASINLAQLLKPARPFQKAKILTKEGCPYCLLAKGWLRRLRPDSDPAEWVTEVRDEPLPEDCKTFPQIWIDDRHVGGYTDLLRATRPEIDFKALEQIARTLTRNLNRTIDINLYPTPETERSNLSHRPIGIGVQGLADLLQKMRLPFASEEASRVNRQLFCCIYYGAMSESCAMAKERALQAQEEEITMNQYEKAKLTGKSFVGAYSSFEGSPLSKGQFQFQLWGASAEEDMPYDWEALRREILIYGVRNSLLLAPMPTASTSQILGNTECFEPITSNIFLRRTLAGEFVVLNRYLVDDLLDLGKWSIEVKDTILLNNGSVKTLPIPTELKELYATVWEIPQKSLIDMAADRGIYICQSQSLNLFMESPSVQKLSKMHFYSFGKGLKTSMYYLRTQAASKAQQFTIDAATCLSCSA